MSLADLTPIRSKFRLSLPFLSTSPETDLKLLFLLLPLWWLLGLEQFIFFPVLLYSSIKLLVIRRQVKVRPTFVLLLLFCGASLLSLVQVDDNLRYFTFARNWLSYCTFTLSFFIITNTIRTGRQLFSLLAVLVISMGAIGTMGFAASFGALALTVRTPIDLIVPSAVADTDLFSRISNRTLGSTGWFSYLGKYYRLRGTFLFATMYAAAVAMTIPLALFCVSYVNRKSMKSLFLVIVSILLWNLFFTTGRTAWAALLIGGLLWFYQTSKFHLALKLSLLATGAVIALVLLILSPPVVSQEARTLIDARGSSSSDRLKIYRTTLEGIAMQPLLGWGTERDVDEIPYPAGSHSYLLGLLYRHGLPTGLLFLGALLATVWRSVATQSVRGHFGMSFLRWSLTAGLLIGLTEVIDLDVVTLMTFSVVVASIHVYATILSAEREETRSGVVAS